ncbi:hypothetical protein VYU27_005705 [Nannochloropsis oceanica]
MWLPSSNRLALAVLLKLYVGPEAPKEDATRNGEVMRALNQCSELVSSMTPTQWTALPLILLEEIEAVGEVQREKPFAALLRNVRDACGASLHDCLKTVMRALQSPDDVITLLALLHDILKPPICPTVDGRFARPTHVEPDSVFGVFLRQVLLDCNGLNFESLGSLLDDIKTDVWAPLHSVSSSSFTHPTSSRQAQQYLQRRVLDLNHDVGRCTYEDTEEEVERLLQRHPELPRGQFLRYLNSTRHGEFSGALDSLHRYFDYAIRRGGPNATGKTSSSRNIVQYASLNLAALHFRLGHTALAFAAINETVRVAQQNADHLCVAFALAWLNQLLVRASDPQAEEVLFRCLGRAADQKLRHLESTTALSLAEFEARGGSRFNRGAFQMPAAWGNGSSSSSSSSDSHLTHQHHPSSTPSSTTGASGPWAGIGSGSMSNSNCGGGTGGVVIGQESSRPRSVWNLLRLSIAAETAGLAPPLGIATPNHTTGPPQPAGATLSALLASALTPRDAFPLSLKEAEELASRRCVVAAGAWEHLGHREMTLLQAKKLLYCYNEGRTEGGTVKGGRGSTLDLCLARIKVALACLRGGGGLRLEETEIMEEESESLAEMRERAGEEREEGIHHHNSTPLPPAQRARSSSSNSRSSNSRIRHRPVTAALTPTSNSSSKSNFSSSHYTTAIQTLTTLQADLPSPIAHLLPHTLSLLQHEQALLLGQSRLAYERGLLLRSLSSPTTCTGASAQGQEAQVEGHLQWAFSLLETGRSTACVLATQHVSQLCEQYSLPWHYMRCLLLHARVHLQANPSDPSAALPPLLRCLTLCETLDTDPLHATTTLLLSQVQLRLGFPRKARALLRAAFPVLLEHAPVRDQGEAWLTLAKCYLQEEGGRGDEVEEGEKGEKEGLEQVVVLLVRAEEAFSRCGDLKAMREVYYLEARVYDALVQYQACGEEGEGGREGEEGEEGMSYMALREEVSRKFFVVVRLLRRNCSMEGGREGEEEGGEEGFMNSH